MTNNVDTPSGLSHFFYGPDRFPAEMIEIVWQINGGYWYTDGMNRSDNFRKENPSEVLVTGATGYIGGLLVARLLAKGVSVRVLVRNPDKLKGLSWGDRVTVFQGDIRDEDVVHNALSGTTGACYLVHAMTGSGDFAKQDREAANLFARCLPDGSHVIYLGGLLPDAERVSEHLKSRAEVGEILRGTGRCTEFRAGPVIGQGSASYDMVRYLTNRLPVMVTPRWVSNPVQPIAVDDVMRYLVAALDAGPAGVVDIGADVLTFKDMMVQYARARGLKRIIIPVPVLAPTLAALWVGLVTPIPNSLAVPLIQGIVHPVVGDLSQARTRFPDIRPMTYFEAVKSAMDDSAKGV